MRIAKSGKNSNPSTKAIKAVHKELSTTYNPIKEKHLPANTRNRYQYVDGITGQEREIYTQNLLDLNQRWIKWINEQKTPVLFQTFWTAQGITLTTLDKFFRAEPEFAAGLEYGKQLIAEKWGRPLMEDMYTIRTRAPVYIKEWRDYDKELTLAKELIKQELQEEQNRKDEEKKTVIVNMVDYGDSVTSDPETRTK